MDPWFPGGFSGRIRPMPAGRQGAAAPAWVIRSVAVRSVGGSHADVGSQRDQAPARRVIDPVATSSSSSAMVAWPVIAKGSRLATLEYLSSSDGFTVLAST